MPRFHELIRIGSLSIGDIGEHVAVRWFGITILTLSVAGARRLHQALGYAVENAAITRSIARASVNEEIAS